MSEPMDVWVARSGDETLWLFRSRPIWYDGGWRIGERAALAMLPEDWLPNLKPGECRRMLLVDAPEKGEREIPESPFLMVTPPQEPSEAAVEAAYRQYWNYASYHATPAQDDFQMVQMKNALCVAYAIDRLPPEAPHD